MNGILAALSLALCLAVAFLMPAEGPAAVVLCAVLAVVAGFLINKVKDSNVFLVRVFIGGLLVRMLIGSLIFGFRLQEFFGGDAFQYDDVGYSLFQAWKGQMGFELAGGATSNWGMFYLVAIIYTLVERNMLAVQFVNSVLGAATAPLVFLCTRQIFNHTSAARIAALCVAFYPSLVLWSSQGLKDGPIVFLLVLVIFATLKLGERLSARYFIVLVFSLLALLSLRFYIFYMVIAAVGGAFMIGMRQVTAQDSVRQYIVIIAMGLAMTYLGVLRTAGDQYESFGTLERAQLSRADLIQGKSGFSKDVDISTSSGAISAIPVGMVYLLFAPFPWQLANLRQSITLPEMIIWWASFPLLVLGMWFTLKYRFRQSLPIMIFTSMLTLAYSIFQGNVGTAYRQRSQILVFYFIFVAVGIVLIRERNEDKRHQAQAAKRLAMTSPRQQQGSSRNI